MGRPSNKEQRREQIVNALLTVMSVSGYDKASIQNIAKEADLTPGLVHYHFKNKQEILIELIKSIQQVAQNRYQFLSADAANPEEKLACFIDAALALGPGASDSAVAAWVVIGSEAIKQNDVKQAYQTAVANSIEELTTLLTNVAQEKQLTIDVLSLQAIATTLYGAIEGAYQLASSAQDIVPTNYAAKTVKHMALASLLNLTK